ncbi:hypothetical protein ABZS96_40660 [Streptomyces avermitilis]|uniref:hypothetical protein n=1 Tax=Streptomyces avermitilis TaxID=33903 RepID=UPI0033BD3D2D
MGQYRRTGCIAGGCPHSPALSRCERTTPLLISHDLVVVGRLPGRIRVQPVTHTASFPEHLGQAGIAASVGSADDDAYDGSPRGHDRPVRTG